MQNSAQLLCGTSKQLVVLVVVRVLGIFTDGIFPSPPPSSFGSSLCALLVCAGEPLLLLLLLSSSSRNFSNVCEYCRNAHVYEENSVAFYGGTKQAAEMEFRYGGCFYKKTEII